MRRYGVVAGEFDESPFGSLSPLPPARRFEPPTGPRSVSPLSRRPPAPSRVAARDRWKYPAFQGDVFWVDREPGQGHEQHGTRPVLIISNDLFNERSGTVIAVPITGSKPRAGFPLTHELPASLMPRPSWVKVSQIRALASERLRERIAHLPPEELVPILEGLNEIIAA